MKGHRKKLYVRDRAGPENYEAWDDEKNETFYLKKKKKKKLKNYSIYSFCYKFIN